MAASGSLLVTLSVVLPKEAFISLAGILVIRTLESEKNKVWIPAMPFVSSVTLGK